MRFLAVVPLLAASAMAQEAERTTPVEQPSRATFTLSAWGEGVARTELNNAPGDVQVSRFGANFEADFKLGEHSTLIFRAQNEESLYSFRNATGFAGGFSKPWDDCFENVLNIEFIQPLSESWFVLAEVEAINSQEKSADFSDSLTYGGLFAVNYIWNKDLITGIGVAPHTRLEDNFSVLPWVNLRWKIAPQWSLNSTTNEHGEGAEFVFTPNETIALGLGFQHEAREFRLNTDGAAPRGVAQERRFPIYVRATWTISPHFTLEGRIGAVAGQTYRLEDSTGAILNKIDGKTAGFGGLILTVNF
jgi:hypothetical protein